MKDWTTWSIVMARRPPAITPLDFFLLGYVRVKVYAYATADIEVLKTKINFNNSI